MAALPRRGQATSPSAAVSKEEGRSWDQREPGREWTTMQRGGWRVASEARTLEGDHMEESACTEERAESTPVIAPDVELTATDRERLTFFKWRYVLQADGF